MRTQKASLYNKDFNAWLHDQIHMIKTKDFKHLDIDNLLEEMETLGNSNPHAIESHIIIILVHMLKHKYQPSRATKSWDSSIFNSKIQIKGIIKYNPSLKKYPASILDKCYKSARRYASKETGIELRKFAEQCPWTIKEVLGE